MRSKLGQHFLKNPRKIRQFARILEPKDGDIIIEIGPGHGELTVRLEAQIKNLESKIIAIEKDKNLVQKLKKRFGGNKKIEIIEGDVLKILPYISRLYSLDSRFYKIVGNIPYYITGRLLRILSELEPKPALVVLTVQKEVAERICGAPPKMNLLAAITQFWAKPEIIAFISKKDFSPQPLVDTAIIKLITRKPELAPAEINNYCNFVKILFKQPRKTLLNNLKALGNREKIASTLANLKIKANDRPQNLDMHQVKNLARLLGFKKN